MLKDDVDDNNDPSPLCDDPVDLSFSTLHGLYDRVKSLTLMLSHHEGGSNLSLLEFDDHEGDDSLPDEVLDFLQRHLRLDDRAALLAGSADPAHLQLAADFLETELKGLQLAASRLRLKLRLPGRLGRTPNAPTELDLLHETWSLAFVASSPPADPADPDRIDLRLLSQFKPQQPDLILHQTAAAFSRFRLANLGKPLLPDPATPLSPGQLLALDSLNRQLQEEYNALQLLLLRRLDVTVQAFLWSPKGEAHRGQIEQAVQRCRPLIERPLWHNALEVQEARASLLAWRPRSKSGGRAAHPEGVRLDALPDRGGRVTGGKGEVRKTAANVRARAPVKASEKGQRSETAGQPQRKQKQKRMKVQGNWNKKRN